MSVVSIRFNDDEEEILKRKIWRDIKLNSIWGGNKRVGYKDYGDIE